MDRSVQEVTQPCPKCGGDRRLFGCGTQLGATRLNSPYSSILSLFRAVICTMCGFTELYAEQLENLKA